MTRPALLLASAAALAVLSTEARAEAPREVEQVVVTAAPYAVSLDSVATSVNVVTREQLDVAPPAGLGDLLASQPGLRSTAFGPGASRPIIRGLSGPRVLILQNGVGLIDASALSPDHAVASEPGQAERIEVLRGPSTLAYGGSAIGGVVNVLDDRIPDEPATGGLEGRLAAAYDWNNDGGSISGGLKAGSGPWVVAIDGVHRRSGDYETPLPYGEQANSDVTLDAYGAGVSYVGGDGFVGISVKRTTTAYGVPFEPEPGGEGPVGIDLEQTRWDLRAETGLDLGPFERARLSVGHADYEHAEIERATGETGTRFLADGLEGRLELVQRQRGGWQGAVGAQGLTRQIEAIGDEAFIPSTRIEEAGVFTLQRLDQGGWGVEGGVRLDRRRLSPKGGAAREFTNASASAAVFWRPGDDWFLSLAASRNGRAPTESELFADGPHAGTGSYELGDPALASETAASLEATLRWTGARGRLEAHLFAARYDGFIDEIPTGGEEDDLPVFHYVQTDATFTGGEVSGTWELWRNGERALMIEGAYDTVRGDTDLGPPARIPPWSATTALAFDDPRFDLRLEVRHLAGQDRTAAFEASTGAYTLVNARAGWRPFAERDVRLFAEARNLGDVEVREHASFLKAIAPAPGRTLRAGAALSF